MGSSKVEAGMGTRVAVTPTAAAVAKVEAMEIKEATNRTAVVKVEVMEVAKSRVAMAVEVTVSRI